MSDYLIAAAKAAQQAGALMRERSHTSLIIERKAEFDFVTNVDKESESIIHESLSSKFPTHAFFGEEGVSQSKKNEDKLLSTLPEDGYMWIVDALDGTTNYIRGIPQCVISIALAHGNELALGVIYDPWRDELYTAEKGCGAFRNKERIHVSQAAEFSKFIFSTSYPAVDMQARSHVTGTLDRINDKFMSLRIYNCAALCLAYTACGHLDAHFELGLHIWDMAAGALLVSEAGGTVTDGKGKPFSLLSKDILASNGSIHSELCELLCP